jgi:hypothetical protein
MTIQELVNYVAAGAAAAAILSPAVGAIGHAFAALPWVWAKTLGNLLNAISVDFKDLKDAKQNAQIAVIAKKVEEQK